MLRETESDAEALHLRWVRGSEAALLELLLDVVLVLTLVLFWSTWPAMVNLWVCAVLGFGLLLGLLWRLVHHLSRSGQEESIDLSSLDLSCSEFSKRVVLASFGSRFDLYELYSWMWWSPVCVVLQLRDASQSRVRLLVIWRHRVGESGFRLLRRRLKTRRG